MQKKELVAVLVLAAFVALAAVVRLFSAPLGSSGGKPRHKLVRPDMQPAKDLGNGAGQAPLWPPLNERTRPADPAARRLLEAADTLAAEALFDAAIAAYQHFLDKYPGGAPAEMALLRIAQCHTLAKRPGEAAGAYEVFLRRCPDSPFRPLALLWCGDSLLRIGQRDLARTHLAEVVARFPNSPFVESAKALLATLDGAKSRPK